MITGTDGRSNESCIYCYCLSALIKTQNCSVHLKSLVYESALFFLPMVLRVSTDGEEPDLETAHLHPGQICEQHKPWPNKTSPLGTETSLSAGQEAQASAKWKNNRQRVEGWNSSLVCQRRAAGERTCQGLCSDPLPPLSPRLPSITARSLWLPFSLSPFCFPIFLYLALLTLWYDSLKKQTKTKK